MNLCSLANILQPPPHDRPVAWEGRVTYTTTDFLHAVTTQRNALRNSTGQRWLLVQDNTWHFATGFFALLAAGKQVVLPPNAQPGTLATLTDHFDAIFSDVMLGDVAEKTVITENIALDTDALTITLLTSGSTGEPKAVSKTLRCLDNEIRTLESLWGDTLGNAVVCATVSHQHIYGLLFRLLWPLCAGRPFAAHAHQYPEPLVAELQQQSQQKKNSVLVSSPSQLKRFPPAIDLSTLRTSLRAVFSSGGPLPTEAAHDWRQRWGQLPTEVLGSTETGGVAWRQQNDTDTAWQCLPGVITHVDDTQQLFVQSPFTGSDNALMMGDRATLLDDRHFLLLGRADRLVKIEEKRLSLTDMEHRLQLSPWIAEARVVVLPQVPGRLGVVATLQAAGKNLLDTQGKPTLVHHLREYLGQYFERVLLPRKWRFVEQWPTDMQGKVSHTALAALFDSTTPASNTAGSNIHIATITTNATQRELRIALPVASTLFDGHFPDLPILPGVVQFDIAVRQCSDWYPLADFRNIEKLKFSEPVVPGDTVTLILHNNGSGQVQFSYTLDGQPLSSGRIVFTTH